MESRAPRTRHRRRAHDTRNKKVRLTGIITQPQARGEAKARSPNSRMSEVSHRLMTASRTSVIHGSFPGGCWTSWPGTPFPKGSCNGHVLLVAFLLAAKALTRSPVQAAVLCHNQRVLTQRHGIDRIALADLRHTSNKRTRGLVWPFELSPGLQTVVDPDVQLAIEAAEAPKRRVDGVESVGGSDVDRLPTTLHAIHERQKLGDYARLVTLGSNGVKSHQ